MKSFILFIEYLLLLAAVPVGLWLIIIGVAFIWNNIFWPIFGWGYGSL